MTPLPRTPLAALLAAGLLGFTACAETDSPPADVQSASPDTATAAATPPKPADDKPAAKPAPSPEDKAAADTRRRVDRLALEKLRLDTEMQIATLKERESRLDDEDERARVEAETALRAAKTALANAKEDAVRTDRDREIAVAALKAALARRKATVGAEEQELDAKLARQTADNEVLRLAAVAARNKRENDAARVVDATAGRPADPLKDGVLRISDRRIVIDGLITDATAAGVIAKLNFFGVADPAAPVFVVMETVPGGSAMACYQIMKAIESSSAPVHVVAKGTVGGGAAALVAAAKYSYTLPNSRLVFQQAASPLRGTTLGSQQDSLRVAESWYARIHAAVAAKEGLEPAAFAAETYRHSAVGDWLEFGDKAVARKWVNTLVERIADESVTTLPAVVAPSTMASISRGGVAAAEDAAGRIYFALPPLSYGDQWMIFDPEHRYRPAN